MRDRKINVKRRPYYNVWNFYSVAGFENIVDCGVVVLVGGRHVYGVWRSFIPLISLEDFIFEKPIENTWFP